MNQYKIGFSGAGSIASHSFAVFLRSIGFSPVGHDCSERIFLNSELDMSYQSPSTTKYTYQEFLTDFLLNKCDFYFPFLDSELLLCANLCFENPEIRKKIQISPALTINICNDKAKLKTLARRIKIHTIDTAYTTPAYIKPRSGSGGKESLIVNSQSLLNCFHSSSAANDFLLEKYIPGTVLSVDVVLNSENKVLDYFCRIRPNTSGVSALSAPLSDESMIIKIGNILNLLASELLFVGFISVQFILYESELYLLEINPRLGGSASHSHMLGSTIFYNFFHSYLPSVPIELTNHPKQRVKQVARFYIDLPDYE